MPAAWLSAVLSGHRAVAGRLDVTVPILVLVSARGHRGTSYAEAMLTSDIVLDPDAEFGGATREAVVIRALEEVSAPIFRK